MNNLLTSLENSTSVVAGGTIPLGSAVHGFGRNIKLNGNSITISGCGYYDVVMSASIAVTGTGAVTVQLMDNGVAIPGAVGTATPSAAGAVVNISFPWKIRNTGCSNLSYTLSEAATVQSMIVDVTQGV